MHSFGSLMSTLWYLPRIDHELPLMSKLDELFQVIFNCFALFGTMSFILVIRTVQTLVPFGWVFAHLARLPEVRFMLYLLQDLMDWLLKCYIDSLRLDLEVCTLTSL